MSQYGKVAVITGGAGGIGNVHATRLAKQGEIVAVLYQNENGLEGISQFSNNIVPINVMVRNCFSKTSL